MTDLCVRNKNSLILNIFCRENSYMNGKKYLGCKSNDLVKMKSSLGRLVLWQMRKKCILSNITFLSMGTNRSSQSEQGLTVFKNRIKSLILLFKNRIFQKHLNFCAKNRKVTICQKGNSKRDFCTIFNHCGKYSRGV